MSPKGHPQQEVLLDETDLQHAKQRTQTSRSTRSVYENRVRKLWLLELLSVLVGVVSIVALCVLLKYYDGKPAPRTNPIIGVNLSLNTLVSILSTIGRASLLLAVSECISQLKWIWYVDKDRPLEDLDTFDNASRSAWGGLQLLWKVNVHQVASVGALLMIAGLAIDPLSQQLVHYRVESVPSSSEGNASLPFTFQWIDGIKNGNSVFNAGESTSDYGDPSPPLRMKAAIQNGLYAGNSTIEDVRPSCSSGNCTWPSYRSLAVCAQFSDITPELQTKNVSIHRTLPEKTDEEVLHYLSNQTYLLDDELVLFNVSSTALDPPLGSNLYQTGLDFGSSIAFKNNSVPIADVFMIYLTSREAKTNQQFSAIEFQLQWCVQDFTTSVTNGRAITQRLGYVSNFSKPNPSQSTPFLAMNTDNSSDGTNGEYYIDGVAHYTLQSYFRTLFQGTANATGREGSWNHAVVPGDPDPGQGTGQDGLRTILDNVATGMTNVIRSNYNATRTTSYQGSVYLQETFVEIQWGWIAAPVILLLGSAVFFIASIISFSGIGKHRKPEVWKSSNLPLLKALNPQLHSQSSNGMGNLSVMEDWARDLRVRLSRDVEGDRWQLVPSLGEKEDSESEKS